MPHTFLCVPEQRQIFRVGLQFYKKNFYSFSSPHLAQVLTTELLEKGTLAGNCKPVQVLLKYEEELKELAANSLCEEKGTLQSKSKFYPHLFLVHYINVTSSSIACIILDGT